MWVNNPDNLANFFLIVKDCEFQLSFLSNITPRNLVSLTSEIGMKSKVKDLFVTFL